MANKKISELPFIGTPNISNTDLIPLVTYFSSVTGDTVHTYVGDLQSVILSANTVTYSELRTLMTNSGLTIGGYYLISDFRTCYDQPDYDFNGTAIIGSNYKQGTISPIMVLATGSNTISEQAFQPEYSGDTIFYDPYFSQTEATSGDAYGRITYRIDTRGNAFDYDFTQVEYKRYNAYVADQIYTGTIGLDALGNVTGTNTSFLSLLPGSIIGVYSVFTYPLINFYEIVSITDDFNMVVTGHTIQSTTSSILTNANLMSGMNWKQNNIISDTGFTEYLTFTSTDFYNNTCGERTIIRINETFLLPNNVFRSNRYFQNSFGSFFWNNTFNDDCNGNIIGSNFYNNIIDNDFDNNIITNNFTENVIVCDFRNNTIQDFFNNNHLGDYDGINFENNVFLGNFFSNFTTGDYNFQNNIIGYNFQENIITGRFENNSLVGDFISNQIYTDFVENEIAGSSSGNKIFSRFIGNKIGNSFVENLIGDSNNVGLHTFYDNTIGSNCGSNIFSGDCNYNQIGSFFFNNRIGDGFGFGFSTSQGNKIGNYFNGNTIGEYFYNNVIADGFYNNTTVDYFQLNTIKCSIYSTDFSLATHVYGNYNCEIYLNATPSQRLSYYDNLDVLTITNINA
jgi:hypothetical protein